MDYQGGDGGYGGGYGGGSSQADPSSAQGRSRKAYDEQTLIPVTIRMVRRAQPDTASGDGSLILQDGRKISMVKIVGAVRSVEDTSTNVMYTLEDGTGLIDVRKWLDDNECSALQELRQETLKEHIYLRIIGQVKEYEGKVIVVANSIRPVASGNELTHHMLEVVYCAERYKRGDIVIPGRVGSGLGIGVKKVIGPEGTNDSANSLKAAVLDIFKNHDDVGSGVHVQVCIDHLNGRFPEAEIRRMIESLSEEGHIYSTVSDDHFQFAR